MADLQNIVRSFHVPLGGVPQTGGTHGDNYFEAIDAGATAFDFWSISADGTPRRIATGLTLAQAATIARVDAIAPASGSAVIAGRIVVAPDGRQYEASFDTTMPGAFPNADFTEYAPPLSDDQILQFAKTKAKTPNEGDIVTDGQTVNALDGLPYRNTSGGDLAMPTTFPAAGFTPALDEFVSFDAPQVRTVAQQSQARRNIGVNAYPTFSEMFLSADPSAGVGSQWTAGEITYVEADPAATDHTIETAGGVKLYAQSDFSTATPIFGINSPDAALLRFNLTAQGTGAGNVIQAFTEDPFTGELFTTHVTGSPRLGVLNKYSSWGPRTQTSHRFTATPSNIVGRQELEIAYDLSGQRWFLSAANESVADQANFISRFQVSDGTGTDLVVSNDSLLKVFNGPNATGSSTSCVSSNGRYVIVEQSGAGEVKVKVFDRQRVLDTSVTDISGPDGCLVQFRFALDETLFPLQSMLSDGKLIYIFTGFGPIVGQPIQVLIYTLEGALVAKIDDFKVGEAEALADPTGYYEIEGAGWIHHAGAPRPAISVASGASGNRTNRIWILGGNIPITGYGDGNKPAFLSNGGNDFGAPDNQILRIGHYDNESDAFTTELLLQPGGKLDLSPSNDGTITVTVESSTTQGAGDISPTTAMGRFFRMGRMMFVQFSLNNIDTSGFGNPTGNFYLHMAALSPAAADSNFDTAATQDVPLAGVFGNDINANDAAIQIQPVMDNTGYIGIREIFDDGTNVIMNADQVDGADISISGWFMV